MGPIDPVNPVYIYKVEQIHAVDGIADGDSNQPRSALGVIINETWINKSLPLQHSLNGIRCDHHLDSFLKKSPAEAGREPDVSSPGGRNQSGATCITVQA